MRNAKSVTTNRNQSSVVEPAALAPQPTHSDESVPTTRELALLAATLRQSGENDLKRLASEALDLWQQCRTELAHRQEWQRDFLEELCPHLDRPECYPISLEQFFKILIPQKRQPEQEQSYRHFLMDWKHIDLASAGSVLAKHRQEPIDRWDFIQRGLLFSGWLKVDLSCSKRENGLRGRKSVSESRLKAERESASKQRISAITSAEESWNKAVAKTLRRFVL